MQHTRLLHPTAGPVHVWTPDDYSPIAGATVFIHGWNLGKKEEWYVDRAINDFSLERKFEASGTRSMCIAIASREGKDGKVRWHSLAALGYWLNEQGVNMPLYVHAIGHSGAWDNLARWIKAEDGQVFPQLQHVSLLDATYSQAPTFAFFAKGNFHATDVCVSKGTATHKNSWNVLKELKGYHTFLGEIDDRQITRVAYVPRQRSHMSWVEKDDIIVALMKRRQSLQDFLSDGGLP